MSAFTSRRLQVSVAAALFIAFAWAAGTAPSSRAQSSQSGAQTAQPASQTPVAASPAPADVPEMSTQEAPVPLQTRVSVVPVRVVVRDAAGHAVGNLHKEDFQLFEDGKPQIISNFAVETLASIQQHVVQPVSSAAGNAAPPPPAFLPPSRFVALLFDDAHLNLQDLMQARLAAMRYLNASVAPTDRVAVFTTSGQTQMDFSDDRAKLRDTLAHLLPRDVTAGRPNNANECPPMDFYEADAIQNHHDPQSTAVAVSDAMICQATPADAQAQAANGGQPTAGEISRAQSTVEAVSLRIEEEGEQQNEFAFRRLREVIQRMSSLPGQRNIVLISPGFIYPNMDREFSELVDRAIRWSVFINTLDARGLYTPEFGPDISQSYNDPNLNNAGFRSSVHLAGEESRVYFLLDLARDTGGYSFHGRNDLDEGLSQVAAAPDTYYYLAFSPQNLKYDGRLHSLKVTLVSKEKYTIQARQGYYAPLHGDNPADIAKRDIEDAVFSQEEQHGLPVDLQTQYFKTDASNAKLAVLARVDLAHIHFVKAAGRNQDDLTVVAALFDRNGNFITAEQRIVQMKLRDETLARLSHSGVTVRTNFDVKPGDYVVRLVVRDSTAAQISAENGVVEIPY
ncbi:MAG TPA: VWA domain-containing protein [Candidatus Acidoferrales bacterium]|nr:VWA domain-containing protein [Candidatus Acidoferrales bacterium]